MELLLCLQIPNIIHHILVGASTVVKPTKRLILLACLMCPDRIVLTPSKSTKLMATMENVDLARNTILSTKDHQAHQTEKNAHIEATITKVRKYWSIRKGLHHRNTTLNDVVPFLSSPSISAVWETRVMKPRGTSLP
jgi:hypothetical protein